MTNDSTGRPKKTSGKKSAAKKAVSKTPRARSQPVADIAVPPGIPNVFDAPDLLKPPVRRAAYSDRTAWLMAALSELAYFQFEGTQAGLESLITDIHGIVTGKTSEESRKKLSQLVIGFLLKQQHTDTDAKERLRETLAIAGLTLDSVYNAAGTQAFLAHRDPEGDSTGMRVLVFRGTEMNMKDVWTDLDATMVPAIGAIGDEKVHRGFQRAYEAIRADVEKDLRDRQHLPLYIAGHSLGGALAIVATWFTAANSLGACYTFGGPRVGNLEFGERFKTPIYRVVNASDYVPRVPPNWVKHLAALLRGLCRLVPVPGMDFLIRQLHRFSGYVHFGDMRYLRYSDMGANGDYPMMRVISNPALSVRAGWVIRRWISTRGKGGVEDHSISIYRKKLRAFAVRRNS
ncbi:MAG: lipase family protein [Alphaproteobacteria bacterium]